jgi:hypothetical protein
VEIWGGLTAEVLEQASRRGQTGITLLPNAPKEGVKYISDSILELEEASTRPAGNNILGFRTSTSEVPRVELLVSMRGVNCLEYYPLI